MKRSAALMLAIIMLITLLPISTAQAASDYSWIKVKLSTNNATSLTIYASGKYFIKENGAEFTGGTVSVRSNGDGTMTLSHSSLGDIYTGSSLSIMKADISRNAGYLKLNSRCYLGHFNLKCISSGYIRVVNEVPLAHYLYGVVGYEMSNTFPIEALKAQAIAAKCYVFSKLNMSGDYYIGDTSSEQVYKGYDASYTNVIEAVDSTLDQVLSVDGKLLCTYYAASNGGETLLPSQAWPSKNVSNKGYSIELDSYDLSNAYSKMETIKIPINMAGSISQNLMSMMLSKASKALGYSVNQINSISSVELHDPKYSGTTRCMDKCTITFTASQSGSNAQTVKLTFYTSEFGTYGVTADSTLRSYWGEMTSSGYYHIYHVRFGHGVGMSQRGAQARAQAGHSYKDILKFYYPGASFASINVSSPNSPSNSVGESAPEGNYVQAVTTGNVRMRSGAGTNYSSLGTVPEGSEIYVYEIDNGWAYAAYDGKLGYISGKYVSYPNGTPAPTEAPEVTPSPTPSVVDDGTIAFGSVNGHKVNLRTGPATSYDSIARLDKGTELNIYASTNGWYAVKTAAGQQGYMISTYVSITGYPSLDSDADEEEEVTDTPGEGTENEDAEAGENDETETQPDTEVETGPEVIAYGKVTGQGVNFRTGPATSYQSMKKLDKGTELELYAHSGSWYYCKAADTVGYISSGYVEITGKPETEPPRTDAEASDNDADDDSDADGEKDETAEENKNYTTMQVGKINASGVSFRIGPGTSYTRLKKLSKDTGVYILGKKDSWYNVQTGGIKGYVYDDYVTVTGTEKVDASGNVVGENENLSGATGKGETTGNVRLREGSSTDTKTITTLSKGTALTLYGMQNGWYVVKLPDGTGGYVSSKYVKVTQAYGNVSEEAGSEESETSIGTGTLSANVNFRQGPSTSAKKLTTIPKGSEVTLFALKDGWYEAEYKGNRGYLYAKYVAKNATVGTNNVGTVDKENEDNSSSTDNMITVDSGSTATLSKGVTTGAGVNFRKGPGTDYDKYDSLAKGTELEIIGQTGTWYYVVCKGNVGFISTAYVSVTSAGSAGIQQVSSSIKAQTCKVNASGVNLRIGPSTGHTSLDKLSKDTQVTVYYVTGDWCFVKCGSVYGFVHDDYLTVA